MLSAHITAREKLQIKKKIGPVLVTEDSLDRAFLLPEF